MHRVDRLDEAGVSGLVEGDDAEALVADLRLLVEQARRILPAELDRLVVRQLKTAG